MEKPQHVLHDSMLLDDCSESERSSSQDSPIDAVIKPLRTLVKYCLHAPMFEESSRSHQRMDQLDENLRLFKSVHSAILPSLKDDINFLPKALGLLIDSPQTARKPDLESLSILISNISESLEDLDGRLGTLNCFSEQFSNPSSDSISNDTDRLLKDLKHFKFSRLVSEIRNMITSELGDLLYQCVCLMEIYKEWKSIDEQDGRLVLTETSWFNESINRMIRSFVQSDFSILREGWQREIESLDDDLHDVTETIDQAMKVERGASPMSEPNTDEQEEMYDQQKRILGVAHTCIPLLKLARLLLHKLSKMTRNQSPFVLDPELDSSTLKILETKPMSIARRIHEIARIVMVFRRNPRIVNQSVSNQFQSSCNNPSDRLESTLLLLSNHIVPWTHDTDHSSCINQFTLWSNDFKDLWTHAVSHFKEALSHDFGA